MSNNINKIRVGDFLSKFSVVQVESIDTESEKMFVQTRDGKLVEIKGKALIESYGSANQYTETKKVGKNEMARRVAESRGVINVEYTKNDGSQRNMTCYVTGMEQHLGYISVIDVTVGEDDRSHGIRRVDARTIEYAVIDNVKYHA